MGVVCPAGTELVSAVFAAQDGVGPLPEGGELAGVVLGVVVSLFLRETAPKKIRGHMDKPVRAVA